MPTEIERIDRRVKWALLVVSCLALVGLIGAALSETRFADWRQLRREYAGVLDDRASSSHERAMADAFNVEIVQNVVPALGRTDRCITCHTGMDDPRMRDQPHPFSTHPGHYLQVHDPNKFGCTICHEGQGLALEIDDAHGRSPHWEYPMLDRRYLRSSCTRCHAEAQVHTAGFLERLDESGDVAAGATLLRRGRRLAESNGCLGCHLLRGKGGTLGTDLTLEGDKTRHGFDFSHANSEHEVSEWLRAHFLNPQSVSPGSLMPAVPAEEDADALTAYMLSLRSRTALAVSDSRASESASGRRLWSTYCSACHGDDGRGSEVADIFTPSLNNSDALSVFSEDYLRQIIANGRSGTDMPAWREGAGNLSVAEIDRIVDEIQSWEQEGAIVANVSSSTGDLRSGRAYYLGRCANCHGRQGEGGVGNSLNSQTFLAVASDRFLAQTIIEGRPGTAMPSSRELSGQAVSDILRFIRSWQAEPPSWEAIRASLPTDDATAAIGARVYAANCASCHGASGEGGIGPSLRTPDLLGVVDQRYLATAIVHGRPDTAMPAWKHLPARDVAALLNLFSTWRGAPPKRFDLPRLAGDPVAGKLYYDLACVACHGDRGRGGVGPQIANRNFLAGASNELLFHWIRSGRQGTAMKGFAREEQGPHELSDRQIVDIIAYLRDLASVGDPPVLQVGAGDPTVGGRIFAGNCASCHGVFGEGASGPQLNNPSFLRAAPDGFLEATVVLGRTDTAMRAMVHGREGLAQIDPVNVADLVAYMRLWESTELWRKPRPVAEMSKRAIDAGREMYAAYCAGCHGPTGHGGRDGEGYFAPALNNPEFLEAASDGFLLATIARGRRDTPMPAYGMGGEDMVSLPPEQISDIVSFLRSWQADSNQAEGVSR